MLVSIWYLCIRCEEEGGRREGGRGLNAMKKKKKIVFGSDYTKSKNYFILFYVFFFSIYFLTNFYNMLVSNKIVPQI